MSNPISCWNESWSSRRSIRSRAVSFLALCCLWILSGPPPSRSFSSRSRNSSVNSRRRELLEKTFDSDVLVFEGWVDRFEEVLVSGLTVNFDVCIVSDSEDMLPLTADHALLTEVDYSLIV